MDVVRTPDERFEQLRDVGAAHFLQEDGGREIAAAMRAAFAPAEG